MPSDSATKFIKRNRPPRVQISYADPYDAEANVELPFVTGVMADLSGNASKVEKEKVADRDFTHIDAQNFDDYMESVEPASAFTVKNKLNPDEGENLGVNLTFKSMEDFDPGKIARQVPALNSLIEAREQLANLERYMNGKSAAQDQLKDLLKDPKLMAALEEKRGAASGGDDSEDE